MPVVHWDEVEPQRRAKGEMDATWQRLGDAAGARGVGLSRVRVAAGKLPTPPHSHGASEEVYFVLGGSGLAWQDGEVHQVRPQDCIVHRADEHEHTFVAGPDGLDFLVYSEEEEVFVVLAGEGTLELWPSPVREARGAQREDIPVRPGHVVARPPGTGIAHSFLAGPQGLTMLVYGTRRPNDMCWYPRSSKIYWRGLGVIGRIESLDYGDGEPSD